MGRARLSVPRRPGGLVIRLGVVQPSASRVVSCVTASIRRATRRRSSHALDDQQLGARIDSAVSSPQASGTRGSSARTTRVDAQPAQRVAPAARCHDGQHLSRHAGGMEAAIVAGARRAAYGVSSNGNPGLPMAGRRAPHARCCPRDRAAPVEERRGRRRRRGRDRVPCLDMIEVSVRTSPGMLEGERLRDHPPSDAPMTCAARCRARPAGPPRRRPCRSGDRGYRPPRRDRPRPWPRARSACRLRRSWSLPTSRLSKRIT